jgi:hypothetical protein
LYLCSQISFNHNDDEAEKGIDDAWGNGSVAVALFLG